jgi:MFS transporter, PAT family, beta-lactamase induction signal transducer AmpG
MAEPTPPKLTTWQSLKAVSQSWRLASTTLLMFSSALPLGLVWIAIPAWMARNGVDIKTVGLFGLAQLPWNFKFLWSPFMDRYTIPFLGRKRGWMFVTQMALFVFTLGLAGAARHPDAIWVIGAYALAIAFASASQDIAYDAYTVEVLQKEEYGPFVAARALMARGALFLSGGLAITLAASWSWAVVNLLLAACYVPMMLITWRAPEPQAGAAPPTTLRDAVWDPFVGFLAQHRAIEILLFVVLFKLSDNLTQALLRPFFVQLGFGDADVGAGSMAVGTVAMIAGTAVGGLLTGAIGLGRALWVTGFLQIFSNLGYAVLANAGPSRPILYAAQVLEMACSGLGTGAFGVLLLRLTQKRFSATQYALLSSLMAITRSFTVPIAGVLIATFGWWNFFIFTVLSGIPGMVMLHRFVPWSVRDPVFHVTEPKRGAPLTKGALIWRAVIAGGLTSVLGYLTMAVLNSLGRYRAGEPFDVAARLQTFPTQLSALLFPTTLGAGATAAGVLVSGVLIGMTVAATLAARRGISGQAPTAPGPQA